MTSRQAYSYIYGLIRLCIPDAAYNLLTVGQGLIAKFVIANCEFVLSTQTLERNTYTTQYARSNTQFAFKPRQHNVFSYTFKIWPTVLV